MTPLLKQIATPAIIGGVVAVGTWFVTKRAIENNLRATLAEIVDNLKSSTTRDSQVQTPPSVPEATVEDEQEPEAVVGNRRWSTS